MMLEKLWEFLDSDRAVNRIGLGIAVSPFIYELVSGPWGGVAPANRA